MVATPNGQKTLAQIQSELQQAGYNGPWTNNDMVAAYLRTAGGAVAPQNAAPQVFGATPQVAGQGDLASLARTSGALYHEDAQESTIVENGARIDDVWTARSAVAAPSGGRTGAGRQRVDGGIGVGPVLS